jgi:hypothetical protein
VPDATGRPNSGAFGIDTAPSLGRGATDGDGRLRPEGLQPLWNEVAPRFAESRRRILFANDVSMGKVKAPIPKGRSRNHRIFAPMLPHQLTVPLHNHNVLGRKRPRLKRYTSGTATAPQERATRIEQWVNPMIEKLVMWGELIGMLQDEGEMGAIVAPSEVMPQQSPPPFNVDPYDPSSPPREEWLRDAGGRGIEAYFGREDELVRNRDGKKTAEAYEQALEDWRLDNPPIDVRLIHATDCVPIGLRIRGDGPYIEGLLIKGEYSRTELIRRQLVWGTGPQLEALSRSGPRDVTVYEGWLTDENGRPYVVYSVQGLATRWQGGNDDDWAYIDLAKFGMTRQLTFYEYGWHKPVRDPDMRGVPFAYPFASGWLAAQAMLGAAVANVWARGHGARGIRPDPNAPASAYLNGSEPRKISWEPGGDLPVLPGEVVDMLPQVISPDVWKIFDLLMGGAAEEGPPPGSFGGPGPESGRERTVIRRHVEDAEAQIFDGGLRMYQKIGIGILELASVMTRKELVSPIPVATTVPITQGGRGTRRTGLIKALDWRDPQGNYALEAQFLVRPGDNLAVAQQAAEFVMKGLWPLRPFLEDFMGAEQPEQIIAEILSDKAINSDQGVAELMDLAARLRNEEREQQKAQLAADGRVAPLSGTPLAITGGLPQPGAARGAPPGPGAPAAPTMTGVPANLSPGAAILGSAVGSEMEVGPQMGDARLIAG